MRTRQFTLHANTYFAQYFATAWDETFDAKKITNCAPPQRVKSRKLYNRADTSSNLVPPSDLLIQEMCNATVNSSDRCAMRVHYHFIYELLDKTTEKQNTDDNNTTCYSFQNLSSTVLQ